MTSVNRSGAARLIANVPPPRIPTVKDLKNALGAWTFQSPNHTLPWKSKKPSGETIKEIVVKKAPKAPMTGDSIVAHVLKGFPTKVYFEKGGSTRPQYFGPVSPFILPK